MDLLVSHLRGYYGRARDQIVRIIARFGDLQPGIEKSGIPGVCVVHTSLDNRQVVARCALLRESEPESFRFAIKWVPVDFWCWKDLESILQIIQEKVVPRIGADETWGMQVARRRRDQYHTAEIIARLAPAIDRKVRLKAPDKLVRIDILARVVAVSVLRPGEIFSVYAPAS